MNSLHSWRSPILSKANWLGSKTTWKQPAKSSRAEALLAKNIAKAHFPRRSEYYLVRTRRSAILSG